MRLLFGSSSTSSAPARAWRAHRRRERDQLDDLAIRADAQLIVPARELSRVEKVIAFLAARAPELADLC
jgi:hypothetical protein